VALLTQPDPAALDNVNTPDELQRARGHLDKPANA
jgi:CTP:molybdopterin cytidylyltransferase MocA